MGLTVAGGGAVVPLALYTEDLEAQYAALPTESTRSDGITAQVLTNVAIGVAAVGAILLLVDLLFLRTLPP